MKLGIIGGTALESLALGPDQPLEMATRWGKPSSPIARGRIGDTEIFFINRHGAAHSLPPHRVNYRANLAALQSCGVDAILAVNAVGGITSAMVPGQLVLPHQIIDYTWGREHSFSDGPDDKLLHIDFTNPYGELLRRAMLAVAETAGISLVDGGVFAITQGPRLETAAEVLRLERDGCDLVGMTGMPEAALARELDIPYVALALVVNPAAGKSDREITLEEIGAVMTAATPNLLKLLEAFCRR